MKACIVGHELMLLRLVVVTLLQTALLAAASHLWGASKSCVAIKGRRYRYLFWAGVEGGVLGRGCMCSTLYLRKRCV